MVVFLLYHDIAGLFLAAVYMNLLFSLKLQYFKVKLCLPVIDSLLKSVQLL